MVVTLAGMDDGRLGRGILTLRRRRRWRQIDLAAAARVSRQFVSKVERGRLEGADLARIRRIADALGVRAQFVIVGDGGAVDRLIDSGHARLHEMMARNFRDLPDWIAEPEVSFSIYGERGIIDVLAWHPGRRALVVIELKTSFVDISALLGAMDRRRRLAGRIARDRGWDPASVSVWVVLDDTPANHRALALHATVMRTAFPVDGRTMRAWLREPGPAGGGAQFPVDCHRRWHRERPRLSGRRCVMREERWRRTGRARDRRGAPAGAVLRAARHPRQTPGRTRRTIPPCQSPPTPRPRTAGNTLRSSR